MPGARLSLSVPEGSAESFKSMLREAGLQSQHTAVSGQSIDPLAVEGAVRIIIALGGGAGIALVLKSLVPVILAFINSGKGDVRLGNRSFKGMTAEQISKILEAEAASRTADAPGPDESGRTRKKRR